MSKAERNREWYERNRSAHIARAERTRKAKHELVRQAKDKPCSDCGVRYPYYVMDLDHARGEKRFGLGTRNALNRSVQAIKDEIDKCDVVCANCHRQRTQQRITL